MAEQYPAAAPRPVLNAIPRRRFASLRSVSALILREMATSYGRSPLGYLWAILEPIGAIVIMTAIFSSGFRSPPMGNNFAIFYASGLLPFLMYTTISIKIMTSLNYSTRLLTYPSVTFVDAILARFILNTLTQLLVGYILFTGILLLFDTQTLLHLPALGLSYIMAAALGLGIGSLNCFITGIFPSWASVWSIMTRPLFILSCIFFLFDTIPEPWRSYLWYNPLVHVVGQARRGIYPYYDAPYVSAIYVFTVSLVTMALGLLFLRHYWRTILQK